MRLRCDMESIVASVIVELKNCVFASLIFSHWLNTELILFKRKTSDN